MQWLFFILTVNLIKIPGNVAMDQKEPYVGSCVGGIIYCVQFVSCAAHVRMKRKIYCKTIGGARGICCRTGHNHTDKSNSRNILDEVFNLDLPTLHDLDRRTRMQMSHMRSEEDTYVADKKSINRCRRSGSQSPSRNSSRFNSAVSTQVTKATASALELVIATRDIKARKGISISQLELGMIKQDLSETPLGRNCLPKPICPKVPGKYRKIDGSCNNLNNPSWGSALSPFSRLLPPNYADGVWAPRVSVVKTQPLPSARLVRSTVFVDEDIEDKERSYLIMQFGQFLSHDITQSVDIRHDNGSIITCCNRHNGSVLPVENRHYACMPIEIPEDDYFYGAYQQRCMDFVRTNLAPRSACTLGYAQQMNINTHFIDGSGIYGSTPEQSADLRSFEKGKLKVFHEYGKDLLPLTEPEPDACPRLKQGSTCFKSGDARTNQIIMLTVLHTVFMREHNRVASVLADLNPKWDDERIFMEARKIVGAELQVIVYKEFLPAVLDESTMKEFNLNLLRNHEYAFDYDENTEPSVINEFTSAVYRFGHSMVGNLLKLADKKKTEMIFIPDVMFNPARMRSNAFIDQVLMTLTTINIQEVDNSITDGLSDHLFSAGDPFGVDLASLNIQRGRDHGVRSYNEYRELVGLPRYTSFEQFGPKVGHKLKRLYASIDDVDLWVGGLLEEKVPGSILGRTFGNIVAEQFSRLKKGDKYFFEKDSTINPGYFSPDQLVAIRKASMARIICDNSDGILLTQQAPNAFRPPGVPGNKYADCNGAVIPRVNLTYWKDVLY